ncbi:MAG: hypothetical protein JNL50_09820 [Phycisphaerae bacterium]|nr:hypothetical protein [Phycisphaerae bacterium]
MNLVVSPYHLTSRELPALAALLLAERVFTLVPAPASPFDEQSVHSAAMSPHYRRFMDSWRWCEELWREGVLSASVGGSTPVGDVMESCEVIDRTDRYADLRALMRPALFDSEHQYLTAVAIDLLRAGPDPGISIPIAAGLDRFAARHRLIVARPEPVSLVQRLESRASERKLAVAIPVLSQADAETILMAREELEAELCDLRAAIARALAGDSSLLMPSAEAYTRAFATARDELVRPRERGTARTVDAFVSIWFSEHARDAALHASVDAARSLAGAGRSVSSRAAEKTGARTAGRAGEPHAGLPVLREAMAGERVMSMYIRPMARKR